MTFAHLHLILNHFPIVGTFICLGILIYGIVRGAEVPQKTALVVMVIIALISIPVLLTGEPAEDAVKEIPGISREVIHEHEEAAESAFWVIEIAGIFCLLSLYFAEKRPVFFKKSLLPTVILIVLSQIAMIRVGFLGGKINHAEVYGQSVPEAED